jgi:hypothetical protein
MQLLLYFLLFHYMFRSQSTILRCLVLKAFTLHWLAFLICLNSCNFIWNYIKMYNIIDIKLLKYNIFSSIGGCRCLMIKPLYACCMGADLWKCCIFLQSIAPSVFYYALGACMNRLKIHHRELLHISFYNPVHPNTIADRMATRSNPPQIK